MPFHSSNNQISAISLISPLCHRKCNFHPFPPHFPTDISLYLDQVLLSIQQEHFWPFFCIYISLQKYERVYFSSNCHQTFHLLSSNFSSYLGPSCQYSNELSAEFGLSSCSDSHLAPRSGGKKVLASNSANPITNVLLLWRFEANHS